MVVLKIFLFATLLLAGCGRAPEPTIAYSELFSGLLEVDNIADLSQPGTRLFSSWDRTFGNDDYNNFAGAGPIGWKILCDVKGSGYISRSWFTGSKDGTKRIRFYIDGERSPRFETSLDEWCGQPGSFDGLPLRGYEPYCWFSWAPVSFSSRLVVMEEAPKSDEKLYYQINVNMLPPGEILESWHPEMLADHVMLDLKKKVNETWERLKVTDTSGIATKVVAEPGVETALRRVSGAGVINSVRIKPDLPDGFSVSERERALRSLVVRMYWDGHDEPSVEVPLGALCGSMWHEIQYGSMYFGMSSGVYRVAFPMPFRSGAEIKLLNQHAAPLSVGVAVEVSDAELSDSMGYFHAGWRKSPASRVGSPHIVLDAEGRGKYVGCLLGVTSLDSSWWALESDERIYVDGEQKAGWQGTGLEDYFNGGWYYGNALTAPLHGIPFKAPFRTLQYRLHLVDPVVFSSSVAMMFERGPDNASRAEMESVSFYYLDAPARADSVLLDPEFRKPVDDPARPYTLMSEVNNMERLGDVQGAITRIKAYLEDYPDTKFKEILNRRVANYADPPEPSAGKAVLGIYANAPARVFLDGSLLFGVNDPRGERVHFREIALEPGEHAVAIQYGRRPYPDWVQLMLEYPGGFIGTDNTWKYAFEPTGKWAASGFDDSSWPMHGYIWVKGPPEPPYVWCEPHDRVFTQSRAWGLRPSVEWPVGAEFIVFRKTFVVD